MLAQQGSHPHRRPAAYRNSVTLWQLVEFLTRVLRPRPAESRPPGPLPPRPPGPAPLPPAFDGAFRITPQGRLLASWGGAWFEPDGALQVDLTPGGDLLVRVGGSWAQP